MTAEPETDIQNKNDLEIFLVTMPGLEALLCAEAREKGFKRAKAVRGGVTVHGGWREVWRANLQLRGASRVLVRIGTFRAPHLAQLDKRARRFPWADFLHPDTSVRVDASCKRSRIYHSGAAAQRIADAIHDAVGAPVTKDGVINVKARIVNDLCTISLDTSGEGLHKRGHKQAVNKAPMRETLAALFLRYCGFTPGEALIDPMCGSGTFVIEAAEMTAGLWPGRTRHFAFENLATHDAAQWQAMKADAARDSAIADRPCCFGMDRDGGAVEMSRANAARAGVAALCDFRHQSIRDLEPPVGDAGQVMVNPPYGGRIDRGANLAPLYRSMGETLRSRFAGWRVGLVTNDPALAKATGLPFARTLGPIDHGGVKVKVYATDALGG